MKVRRLITFFGGVMLPADGERYWEIDGTAGMSSNYQAYYSESAEAAKAAVSKWMATALEFIDFIVPIALIRQKLATRRQGAGQRRANDKARQCHMNCRAFRSPICTMSPPTGAG